MRIIKILFFCLFVTNSFANNVDNRVNIVTSISPLATIFSIIGGDKVKVTSLVNSNICPHYYTVRPSQIWHIQNAQIITYIDSEFETFITPLLKRKDPNQIFKISSISGIKLLRSEDNNPNWHIWLDIPNIKLIMEATLHLLSSVNSDNTVIFTKNYLAALHRINDIDNKMKLFLNNIKQRYVILSPSLEYFFANSVIKPYKFYAYNTINKMDELIKFVNEQNINYVFISNEQDLKSFSSIFNSKVKVIQLESENWSLVSSYKNLLFEKLDQMIKTSSHYLN